MVKLLRLSRLRHEFLNLVNDRRKQYEFLVGIVIALVLFGIWRAGSFDKFENVFLDLRFLLRPIRAFPEAINVIGIDEASLDHPDLGRWPWSRQKHGHLLYLLSQRSFRPAEVGYDVLFENKDKYEPSGDDSLAYRAEQFAPHVFMSYFLEKGFVSKFEYNEEKQKRLEDFAVLNDSRAPPNLLEYDKVSVPYLELAKASNLGFVNAPVDSDGRTRRIPLLVRYRGKTYPSFSLLMALQRLGAGILDIQVREDRIIIEKEDLHRVIPLTDRGEMLINYYGSSALITSYSFLEVLSAGKAWMDGETNPEILQSFKDKLVLVGATALGLKDSRTTPFFEYEPGVSIQAQAIANILDNAFLAHAAWPVSAAMLFLLAFLVTVITMLTRITYSLPLTIGLGVAYFFGNLLLFINGIWIDMAAHMAAIALIFISITSFRYFTALQELKRAQEQLIHSTKMASMGELSAGISHEFRNILNAINLHIEFCAMPGRTPEQISKYMVKIKMIMKNASMILNGLLTFARKSESNKVLGSLNTTVEETLLLIEKEMMRHKISINAQLHDVPQVAFDKGQISQVIMNLINNARDALQNQDEKLVTLTLTEEAHYVRLDIGDNGAGIPPEVLKRLFEPFVTSKPAGKGTGLGLSVCHGIITNHGGEIKVTTLRGKGTTWHIFFPKS
ncbi:MAG: CHASE2 domain-containing protein [Candidatus Omnitrophota bacterium]|nr:CHASE2 domain-containing protein [Candidatus Omnitrophota bacterium]